MKTIPLSAFILLVASNATAGQFWSDDEITNKLIITDNILMVMDWAQTRHIADNPDEFREDGISNLIGEHPTSGDVNRAFISLILFYNSVGYFMPDRVTTFGHTWSPKKVFWLGAVASDITTVNHNFQMGVKFEF